MQMPLWSFNINVHLCVDLLFLTGLQRRSPFVPVTSFCVLVSARCLLAPFPVGCIDTFLSPSASRRQQGRLKSERVFIGEKKAAFLILWKNRFLFRWSETFAVAEARRRQRKKCLVFVLKSSILFFSSKSKEKMQAK